jgi:nucleoside triphosphate pyrophosphatase
VCPTDVDESVRPGEPPDAYVARIAAAKVTAAARADRWVLAADTTVTIDGAILGKAGDGAEAAAMLRRLSGRTHQVLTAFAIGGPVSTSRIVSTDVVFVPLDEATIADYVASGEWRGKAGAYAIQGIAAAFVAAVHGSVTNVIGLPVAEVVAALRELGGPVPRLAKGEPA